MREKAKGIRRETLEMILEASKDTHPREFAALLRAEDGIIYELLLVPGTVSGDFHAIFRMSMMPIDFSLVGTVHSHPSPYPIPSDEDLRFFQGSGHVHIICAYPYSESSWRAWDRQGRPYSIEVVE